MITLDQARAAAATGNTPRVVYKPRGGGRAEHGVIKIVTDSYVFVRYDGATTSKATDPADLEFATPKDAA